MNIVSKVTLAYMKKSKKRTLVTIFGVIISVAMITAVLTSITSFLHMFQQHEISQSGRWIVEYSGMDIKKLDELQSSDNVDKVMLIKDIGYSPIKSDANLYRPYIFVQAADDGALEDMQLDLIQGRLPENDRELVVQSNMISDASTGIELGSTLDLPMGRRELTLESGDKVTLDQSCSYSDDADYPETFIPNGETKTYTVVGIINPPDWEFGWAGGYTALTYLDQSQTDINAYVDVRTTFKKLGTDFYREAKALGTQLGISEENILMHEALLQYYGVTKDSSMNSFLKMFGGLLIIIIMIGSVMMIYNAFAISLSERSRQLGMLSSIGATKRQKRQSVFFEGAVIGCISIPLGILAGIGGMAVTFAIINPMIQKAIVMNAALTCVVTVGNVVASVILAVLTIFISAWIPALRASKISPIDGIRQSRDIKLSRRQVRTSKLTRVLFGFSGELALKNMKRNKKSYRTTIVSLAVSLALFLSIAGYVTMLQNSYGVTDSTQNYDAYVLCEDKGAVNFCASLDSVRDYNAVTRYYDSFDFQKKDYARLENSEYVDYFQSFYPDVDIVYYTNFIGMTPEALEKYIADAGLGASVLDALNVETDELPDSGQQTADGAAMDSETAAGTLLPEEIPVIVINRGHVVTGSYQWSDMELINTQVGDVFALDSEEYYDKNEQPYRKEGIVKIKVAAATGEVPMGVSQQFSGGQAIMLITLDKYVEALAQKVSEQIEGSGFTRIMVYMKSNDPESLTEDVKTLTDNHPGRISSFYSAWETEQSERAFSLMLQVFCYGFVALMTLICTANILNTVSTGIELRRREFAMLKSVGMDPKAFNRMLVFESLFYGLKALLYGVPFGFAVMLLEYRMVSGRFGIGFTLPLSYIMTAVVAVFAIVGISTAYSFGRIKKENILDGLRTE